MGPTVIKDLVKCTMKNEVGVHLWLQKNWLKRLMRRSTKTASLQIRKGILLIDFLQHGQIIKADVFCYRHLGHCTAQYRISAKDCCQNMFDKDLSGTCLTILRTALTSLLVTLICSYISNLSLVVNTSTMRRACKISAVMWKGEDVSLRDFSGCPMLIVNVASMCGFTSSNYKELALLDEKYRDKGLKILAFPCNQFGGQEPGSNEEICSFRDKNNAKFLFFDKVEVNGDGASPLWKYLKQKQGGVLGSAIKWNFSKFLIDKNGQPVERFSPLESFKKIEEKLNKYL